MHKLKCFYLDNLMPHMIGEVVPFVTGPLIDTPCRAVTLRTVLRHDRQQSTR